MSDVKQRECGEKPEEWNKLCRIRHILDHWQDIFDPSVTSTWATFTGLASVAPGSRTPTPLPRMASHPSVRKIERALTALAEREPALVRHLKAYRCNAEWRCKDTWVVVRLPSGKQDIVERRVREKIVPSWIKRDKVDKAETLLNRLVRGDVSIPEDLWHALTKP